MWVVNDEKKVLKISDLFNSINRIYIADGHHRMDALCQNSQNLSSIKTPIIVVEEAYNFFMIAIFPTSQARILDYNRLNKRFIWLFT